MTFCDILPAKQIVAVLSKRNEPTHSEAKKFTGIYIEVGKPEKPVTTWWS